MLEKNRLKELKLVVFDLDGTLLRDDDTISPNVIELVAKLKEKGVRFSFASGRLHSAIKRHAETLQVTTPIISLDGSLIKSYPEGDIVFHSYVKASYVEKAIQMANYHFMNVALCHDEAIYFTEHHSRITDRIEKFGANFQEVESYQPLLNETLEIVIIGELKGDMRKIEKKFKFPYAWNLNTMLYKSHRHGDVYYLEIRKSGCDKGSGLRRLAKNLGIGIKDCAIMGDWYNDRPLFQSRALKVAVQNAVPEIKRMADHITEGTNNDTGVEEFLEAILKAKRS